MIDSESANTFTLLRFIPSDITSVDLDSYVKSELSWRYHLMVFTLFRLTVNHNSVMTHVEFSQSSLYLESAVAANYQIICVDHNFGGVPLPLYFVGKALK